MDEQYNHNWLGYMTIKSLTLTAVSIFHDVRDLVDGVGVKEKLDAMQTLHDELCDRIGAFRAYDLIFHAPGMDQDLVNEFMEMVE